MKRKLTFIIVLLLVALTATSCGNNGLADYKKAAEKTGQITKGQNSGEFKLTMEFHTEGMTKEEINQLNYYQDVSGSFRSQFDDATRQGIYRNYLNLGGFGFDFDIYQNGDEIFAKLPVVGKYIKLDEIIKEAGKKQITEEQPCMVSEKAKNALRKEWAETLKEENVFKGKNIVLTTPDGEVKTTVYTITLNDEQVKKLASNSIQILSEDETLKSNFQSMIKNDTDQTKADDYEEFFKKMQERIQKDTVESFQYTAYVDIDGYIVNETMEFYITREALELGEPSDIRFHLELKNWDISQKQNFEFPELGDGNTMGAEGLEDTMPSILKNLFQTQ